MVDEKYEEPIDDIRKTCPKRQCKSLFLFHFTWMTQNWLGLTLKKSNNTGRGEESKMFLLNFFLEYYKVLK